MIEADVVVLGAGPAGAAAALNLAPFLRVLVVERAADPERRPGESLPGAARRLLADMGLWDAFQADGHRPCHARASRWGGDDPAILDAVRDPDGPGWLIDRARFDARLRETAAARGAAILAPAHLLALARASGGEEWTLTLSHRGRVLPVRARGVIDARGRRSRPWPAFGTRRQAEDRLACGWVVLDDAGAGEAGPSLTLAEAEGWWYAARLPEAGGRRLLAFYTDADLPAAAALRSPASLLARAAEWPNLAGRPGARPAARGVCAAHGGRLARFSGPGWIAAGDAACAFDPLSAQGVLNALFGGLAAAEAMHRMLTREPAAWRDYDGRMSGIWQAYRHHRTAVYGEEARWRDAPFWQRRHPIAA